LPASFINAYPGAMFHLVDSGGIWRFWSEYTYISNRSCNNIALNTAHTPNTGFSASFTGHNYYNGFVNILIILFFK
jgi:hypothetical protein